MGIRVRPHPRSALVALCALTLVGSCSKSPTQPKNTVGGVSITPSLLLFGSLNSTHQLSATVTDQLGNPVSGASVTWSSTNITVAFVSGGGLVTAVGNGSAKVVATSGTVADSIPVTVSQVPVQLTKTGGDAQTYATNAVLPQALSVKVVDSGGAGIPGQTVTFGVVSGGGTLVGTPLPTDAGGVTSASWKLGATVGAQTLSANRSPVPGVTFTATANAPGTPTQMVAHSVQSQPGLDTFAVNFPPSVVVKDAAGLPVSGVSVTFAITAGSGSLTSATPTTDANGVATVGSWKVSDGSNTVRVTSASLTADTVNFSATGQTQQFQIQVDYVVPPSASRKAVTDSAAAKWSRIIYGALPSVPVNLGAGQCFSNKSPAVDSTINGVLIFVELDSIDGPGKILGQAGPCIIRSVGRLPLVGIVQLDTADVAGLESSGEFGEVMTHEMGHILGYGTIWDPGDLDLLVGPAANGGTDPHFIGAQATQAFYGMGGLNYTGGAVVPVENTGGLGTEDGHWRESVFHTELMTGFLNGGVTNPLSVLTIASMGDMGYTVNYAAADSYSQTFSLRAPGSSGTQIHLVNDIIHGPVYLLSPTGHVMGVIQR
ncbi:MAG TPA: leishmanolysin-related zinc metalloendopeptidase [Gemmatimonadales bacterium]|nr:leishmanolysin-related zinc metalloendopeptidase [Gemmatimonadales bacterium]